MRIVFVGTPAVSAAVLAELARVHEVCLVVTREDAPAGRQRSLQESAAARKAQELGLSLIKTNRIDSASIEIIKSTNAELAIVVAYGALVPQSALNLMNWWNLHFSALPLWRGSTPLQHSLIHKTGQGITVFKLDSGMDTGPIIAQQALDLPENVPSGELLVGLASLGSNLLLDAMSQMPEPITQVGPSSLAPKFDRSDAKLDFSKPAIDLQRLIFALNPEPMAWTQAGQSELRVLRATALGSVNWGSFSQDESQPGRLERRKGQVLVHCGSGSLLQLIEVQPSGKRPMAAVDWANGFSGDSIG